MSLVNDPRGVQLASQQWPSREQLISSGDLGGVARRCPNGRTRFRSSRQTLMGRLPALARWAQTGFGLLERRHRRDQRVGDGLPGWGGENSNSEMSPQIIPLKGRTELRIEAESWPPRLLAFELRRWGHAARARTMVSTT